MSQNDLPIKKRFGRVHAVAALCVLVAGGIALFLYLTREITVYVSLKDASSDYAHRAVFILGESRTFYLAGLPQDVNPKDFTLIDAGDGRSSQGACEINGLTVTATKAGYIRLAASAKVGRTTYQTSYVGYVAATAPTVTCNGVPLSGAVPVGARETLPGVRVWADKEIPLVKGGPEIMGDFRNPPGKMDGVNIYSHSFDQSGLRRLKDDYVITVKAEYRDEPFHEIKVKYYKTDTTGEMLNYIAAAAQYNRPDTSTLENFQKFKGVATAKRQLDADDLLVTLENASGGKYVVLEADHVKWEQLPDGKYKAKPTDLSIDWGLTSSMPLDRIVDSVNGAQYAILINFGKEYDGRYNYKDKDGWVSVVQFYQHYYTAELYTMAGKLLETIYREDTSGWLKPHEQVTAGVGERGGFIGGQEAAREKCRKAVMKYIYDNMWN